MKSGQTAVCRIILNRDENFHLVEYTLGLILELDLRLSLCQTAVPKANSERKLTTVVINMNRSDCNDLFTFAGSR